MKVCETNFNDTISDVDKVKKREIDFEFVRQTRSIVKLPEPINRIVSSVGFIKLADETFLPVIPADVVDTTNAVVPVPQFVYLTILRRTVEYLSNPDSNAVFRRNFHIANPIPGTRWNDNNVLINPGDIIPAAYDINHFIRDTMSISPFLNQIETYVPKLNAGTNTILNEQGNKCFLLSNYSKTLCQPELEGDKNEVNLAKLYDQIPNNDIDLFWSRAQLDVPERVQGIITLLGEVSSIRSQIHSICTNRTPQACSKHINFSYKSALTICFGI